MQRRPWDPIEYLAQWLYQHDRNVRNKEQVRPVTELCVLISSDVIGAGG